MTIPPDVDELVCRTCLADQDGPLPLATLSHRAALGLWALRIVLCVLTAMVAWTFIVDLGQGNVLG